MTRSKRVVFVLAALTLGWLAALGSADEKGKVAGSVKLFNGKDLSGWRTYLPPDSKVTADKVWSVHDGLIDCQGMPFGYLLTEKDYGDYVLRLQWRWGKAPAKGGRNSGVFVHVSGPDKIWPKGVEAQLFAGHAGDFWLVDGFKLQVDPARQDKRTPRHYFRMKGVSERPIGEWNQYEITCKGDTIKLVVNGKLANEGTKAEASSGKILLQSEGAQIFFRNIELKRLR